MKSRILIFFSVLLALVAIFSTNYSRGKLVYADTKTALTSAVIGCNQTCNLTINPPVACSNGLTCYTPTNSRRGASGNCRSAACLTSATCGCGLNVPITLSPSGNIGSIPKPIFKWNKVANATKYYLLVKNTDGQLIISTWYTTSDYVSCDTNTCSMTSPSSRYADTYTWQIQAGTDTATSPWSAIKTFTIANGITPATVITSPSGTIGHNPTPTYTWSKDTNDTRYYYLVIKNSSGTVVYDMSYYYPAQSTLCGTSTCSITPYISLEGGTYTWKILSQTSINDTGTWSNVLSFNTSPLVKPGVTTLSYPLITNDLTNIYRPYFRWRRIPDATKYYVTVKNSAGTLLANKWISYPQLSCNSGFCSAYVTDSLKNGTYKWQVRTGNANFIGDWSSVGTFKITTDPDGPWLPL